MPLAALLHEIGKPLEIQDVALEGPRSGEVQVRMAASGVCHSDLSVLNGTIPGAPTPMVLGHEGAGIVEAVGRDVDDLSPGDHVVLAFVPQCGTCFFCSREEPFLCETADAAVSSGGLLDGTTRFSLDGSPVYQMSACGTFAESVVVPASGAVRIDADVPLEAAALLGCGVLTGVGAALNTARIRKGDTVVVYGVGGVGLSVVQGARLAGAGRIVAVDVVEPKLELARVFGATEAVNGADGESAAQVKELTAGRGADVVFEAIGRPETIGQAVDATRRGGQTVLVGLPRYDAAVGMEPFRLVAQARSVQGCWYGSSDIRRDIPRLVELYRSGDLLLDQLVSQRIDLDGVNDAFHAMEAGEVARSLVVFGR